MENPSGKMDKLIKILITLFLASAAVCAVLIVMTIYNLHSENSDFDSLRHEAIKNADSGVDDGSADADAGGIVYTSVFPLELQAENPELAAWLVVPGTNIDYPVMQRSDEEYYLHHDFYGKSSSSGVPFAGVKSKLPKKDKDLQMTEVHSEGMIIYAHNMKNGTMFAGLKNFRDTDFFKENNVICVLTPEGSYEYTAFAVVTLEASSEAAKCIYALEGDVSEDVFNKGIKALQKANLYRDQALPQYGEDIVLLSTCSSIGDDSRLIVAGVRK